MNILNTYYELESHHFDLNVDHYGAETCDKNYSFGPSIRDNYVLHFIVSGKGTFSIDGQTTSLKAGDLFLLPKDKLTFYQADGQEPWSYIWVGFNGSRVEPLLRQSQLLDTYYLHSHIESPILNIMQAITHLSGRKPGPVTELLLIGELHKLLAAILEEFPTVNQESASQLTKAYVQQALKIIHSQYNIPLKVTDLAQQLSLSRSYLYKIFKKETGYALKDYILQVKMNRSCQLLQNTDLSITEISFSVGYTDPLQFSTAFKHTFQMSPSDYRKTQTQK